MSSQTEKRKRKSNFTHGEILVLEEQLSFEENRRILSSKFTDQITNESKRRKWEEIAQKSSAVGPTVKSGTDCSNKWQLMKKNAERDVTEKEIFHKNLLSN